MAKQNGKYNGPNWTSPVGVRTIEADQSLQCVITIMITITRLTRHAFSHWGSSPFLKHVSKLGSFFRGYWSCKITIGNIQNNIFTKIESNVQMSDKVILDCIGFALIFSMIDPKNLHQFSTNQIQLKPNAIWSPAFSRTSGTLPVSYYLHVIFSFALIGCACSGFSSLTRNRNVPHNRSLSMNHYGRAS